MKIPSSNLGRTCCVQKLFLTFRTIFVHNMLCKKKSFLQRFTFNKEIQMIETDESEDEFEDLSKLTDLSKLYMKLIVKVNVENKWSSEKMYDKIKRNLLIDVQEKTFLNGEVENDKMISRQSIMEENLLDDHPKIIGYNCNPNAKKTFASPLIKQEIKKALNSKAVEEREKFNENVSWKKCPLCQCSFSIRTRIDERHEDLNRHMDNCEEFQKISRKLKKYCPICKREPKNSLIFHIKRHILGGSDSSESPNESPSESSEDIDSDDIIIISDTEDNDSIDS